MATSRAQGVWPCHEQANNPPDLVSGKTESVRTMLISHRKAYTAALTQQRTSDLFELVQPGKELFHLMSQDSFCAMGGGAPLVHDGVVVGGLGISGGTVAQDIGILEAALQPRRHELQKSL
ncbi:heme-binding protein [Rhizobium leguminosarum bv. viciae]|uniref:GlcG/HbpS family heme-binding protein n=1 Tax=Rhizobium leguminosarum TaxID=384 RepID=UPI00103F3CF0|nr:heme-binding protein [Rhizobium leguminosarum bv. viciae]